MTNLQRPHILLTNDDGIEAVGIKALADALRETADLTIVAPSQENSGMGHAITVFRDLHFAPVHREGQLWGWGLNGTPADCVKVAINLLGRERPFDAVISGVNMGQNAGLNVLYSGTVAAAREAAIHGLPAMAVSMLFERPDDVPFETGGRVAREVLELLLKKGRGIPDGVLLNVNVPPVAYEALQGWAVTRMGDSGFSDYFELREQSATHGGDVAVAGVEKQMDVSPLPASRKGVELRIPGMTRSIFTPPVEGEGPFTFRNIGFRWNKSTDDPTDTDDHALYANKVAITPLQFDLTAYAVLPELEKWFAK